MERWFLFLQKMKTTKCLFFVCKKAVLKIVNPFARSICKTINHIFTPFYHQLKIGIMKKVIAFIIVSSIVFTGNDIQAQIRKIPAAVTQAFKEKFPEADNIIWKDKLTGFEASFVMNKIKYQTTFNTKGAWKQTETLVTEEDIPDEVQEGWERSKYKDWELQSVSLIETTDSKKFMLVVQKSALQKKRLYFSFNGQLLKDPITL